MFNPGEGFAETYRVLNEQKAGVTVEPWSIVSSLLFPDATALSLLEQDITTPWKGPTLTHVRGAFGNGTVRTIVTKTTLDGTFVARLHAPSRSRMRLALYAGGRLVASGATVRYEICGQRSLTLKVQRLSGRGVFTVDVSKP